MSEITLTVNGKQVKGQTGDTILEVCKANGIEIPTLCHMDGLSEVGSCRMCMVEVEKQRRAVPACNFPAQDGLVVTTHTEALEKHRRQILELIFTEHNHFCMFCEASGDCELQQLGYKYQMDNVRYAYNCPNLSVDTLSQYLVIDHNRCILCGRCIRACSEIAAAHAIDFSQRGWQTKVTADLEQPLGESSCQECGACAQACPTGAIFSKLSIYKGTHDDCEITTTICPNCSVGCELNVMTRDNNLVKIESPDLASDPRGTLCHMGRFDLLKPTPSRLTSPLVRDEDGELKEVSLDEAIKVIADRLQATKANAAFLVSSRLPQDLLTDFSELVVSKVGSSNVDTLDGDGYRIISQGVSRFTGNGTGLGIECGAEEIIGAEAILVIGADPQLTNPVIGSMIRHAVSDNGAQLLVVNPNHDVFPLRSRSWLRPISGSETALLMGLAKIIIDQGWGDAAKTSAEFRESLKEFTLAEATRATGIAQESLERAAAIYAHAERGVIVYDPQLLTTNDVGLILAIMNLASLTGNAKGKQLGVISLKPAANSRGAWEAGLAKGIDVNRPEVLYLLLSDDTESEVLLRRLRNTAFLIVQASYDSPAIHMADVVLPSLTWAERGGQYVSLDGHTQELKPVLQPPAGLASDNEILQKVSQKLG
jgi:formate dehydrogenase major subunit